MMLTVSQTVYSHLMAFNDANGDLFGGNIFPMVAPMDAEYPFVVYQASKTSEFSKKGIHDVRIRILIVGDDYDQLCGISDDLEDYLAANFSDAYYESTDPGLNQDKPSEISIQINYNLKMY
jgi:hypothetical protein